MKLVALVPSGSHVCIRYRLAAFQHHLQAAGYELILKVLPRSPLGRMQLYRTVGDADAVIVQRNLLSWPELRVLRYYAKKLLFDYDDAIWMRDSYNYRGFHSPKQLFRFRGLVKAADAVIAGNEYLAEEAQKHTRKARVAIIPTCVEPDHYPIAAHRPTSAVKLVWIGSQSTLQGLEIFQSCLELIGRSVPGIRLKLICDRFLTFQNLPVDAVPWSAETEGWEIANADIGISWVPDDLWSRGKCGLKILQYQAAGLPVVTNPVGVHTSMVHNHKNGYLAVTPEQWVAAIQRLATDAPLRQTFGSVGRQQVVTDYSVATGGRLWVELLNQLFRRSPIEVAGV